jgi:MoxR-like ATPase
MNDAASSLSARDAMTQLRERVGLSVVGQERMIERLIVALLADGHVLIEGLPGLAKTRAVKSLSQCIESQFSRIQFTPDLLPSDVTGGEIYRDSGGGGSFEFRPGPIFGNLVLGDEINRAPAKVQSALLEAVEERQVIIAGTRHKLPDLFMVLATQNPIEQEGTYPLPEGQMDRFLMHVRVDYPNAAEELAARWQGGTARACAGAVSISRNYVATRTATTSARSTGWRLRDCARRKSGSTPRSATASCC